MGLRNKILAVVIAGFCMLAARDTAYPQARAGAAAPSGGSGPAQQAAAMQAKAWTLFYAGNYQAAAVAVQPLLKSGQREVQVEAAHLFARCLWAANTGSGSSRRAAQKVWKQLDQPLAGSAVKLRLVIAKALALDASGGSGTVDAIDLLNHEHILNGNSGGTAQAEAAIELAELYREAGGAANLDQAGKLLDAIPRFFSGDNLTRLELQPAEIQPFLKAATAAKAALKYDAQPGLAEFEQAEKLRAAGKFPQAIALYQQIIQKYPATDFAPHSDLCIGYCLLGKSGGSGTVKAIEHWQTFTAAAPGGPWRGQAFVALIDLDLERLLDLGEATKEAELAANAIANALDDPQASPSWKSAAFDVYLRIGIVQFIQGRPPYTSAADAFAQAASSDGISGQTKDSLTTLADAAKADKPILPAGFDSPGRRSRDAGSPTRGGTGVNDASSSDQAALALKIGVIYNVAGRFDHATSFFDRVAKGEIRPASAAELAFADFGKAAALQGEGELTAAKDKYLASIKADASGGWWQDEAFYRIARIIELQADAEYPAPPAPADDAPTAKPTPMTSAELDQKTAAERDRQAKLLSAKKSALPYWDELLKRFASSPRIPSAEYHAGILLWQMQQWPAAAGLFSKLVAAYPKDPLAGDAYVRLIDIDLEDTFSLKDAETASAAAVKWASWNTDPAPADASEPGGRRSSAAAVEPWRITALRDPQPDLKASAYAIYLRAGLIAYMDQKMDQAAELLQKGNQFDMSDQAKVAGATTGLARMIDIAQGRTKPVTPPQLLPMLKDDKQKTCMILADLYLETFDERKAGTLYERLMAGDPPFPKPTAGIQAYLLLRIGQTLEFQHRHNEAMACLMRLYDPRFASFPWAAAGIARMGTWTFNEAQDPKQAMSHWKYVFTNMPSSPEAERSLFYYAQAAEDMKDFKTAAASFEEYLRRYPKGEWHARVEEEELPYALRQIPQNTRGS